MDTFLKSIALLGALAFFIYKIAAGGFVPASSLSLAAVPIECEGKVCALVTTKLEHPGENWSFYVRCAELTVLDEDGKPTPHSPITIRYKHPSRATFELGPGDKTECGTIIKGLPFGKPFIIEALFVLEKQFSLLEKPFNWTGLEEFSRYVAYDFASVAIPPLKREQGQGPGQEQEQEKQGDQPKTFPRSKTLGYP